MLVGLVYFLYISEHANTNTNNNNNNGFVLEYYTHECIPLHSITRDRIYAIKRVDCNIITHASIYIIAHYNT